MQWCPEILHNLFSVTMLWDRLSLTSEGMHRVNCCLKSFRSFIENWIEAESKILILLILYFHQKKKKIKNPCHPQRNCIL